MAGVMPTILQFNWQLFRSINGQAGHHPLLDRIMIVCANDLIFLLPLLLLGFWFLIASYSPLLPTLGLFGSTGQEKRRHLQQLTLLGVGAVAVALIFNISLGKLFYEPRPFVAHPSADHLLIHHPADASFPSDHLAVAFAVVTTLSICLLSLLGETTTERAVRRQRWVIAGLFAGIALVAAITIGYARVYVGVHYPGDIVGGAVCGVVATSLLASIRPWLRTPLDALITLSERLHLA